MKQIDNKLLQRLHAEAAASARGRTNHNLHPSLEDPVQRFLNAIEPGSYVRPHRHHAPPRWELFVIVEGHAAVLTFDAGGKVKERVEIAAQGAVRLTEIPAGEWHTLVALRPGTVLLEVKQGPYQPPGDDNFAPWAPQEGDPLCRQLEQWFRQAVPGESFPG